MREITIEIFPEYLKYLKKAATELNLKIVSTSRSGSEITLINAEICESISAQNIFKLGLLYHFYSTSRI